jgi:hypothetical protein
MTTKLKTFRYDFSDCFLEELNHFAIIHKHDDRKVFKAEWEKWIAKEEIKTQIDREIEKLSSNGYVGDVLDKMFKSARYYFRKKKTEKTEKPRKKYTSITPSFLKDIDTYIGVILENSSPASAYESFCIIKKDLLLEQTKILAEQIDEDEISIKIKKTFKNRYHVLKNKITQSS